MSHEDDPSGFPPPVTASRSPRFSGNRGWGTRTGTWGPRIVVVIYIYSSLPTLRRIGNEFSYGVDSSAALRALIALVFSPMPYLGIMAFLLISFIRSNSRPVDHPHLPPPPGMTVHSSPVSPPPPPPPAATKLSLADALRQMAPALAMVIGGVLFAFGPLILFMIESPSEGDPNFYLPLYMVVTLPVGGVIVLIGLVTGIRKAFKRPKY